MKPYPEQYLLEVSQTQGKLFDYVAMNYPEADTADFINAYLNSKTRKLIDDGQAYLATMDERELLSYFLSHEGYMMKRGKPMEGFMPDWIGQFYSQYQWRRGVYSQEALKKVPLPFLEKAYFGLHDLDIDLAVRKVAEG